MREPEFLVGDGYEIVFYPFEFERPKTMASHHDLAKRVDAIGAAEIYLSQPPKWFTDIAAHASTPIVVNCKGLAADSTPVVLTLAEYERLTKVR